jgi:hypothetical protein
MYHTGTSKEVNDLTHYGVYLTQGCDIYRLVYLMNVNQSPIKSLD